MATRPIYLYGDIGAEITARAVSEQLRTFSKRDTVDFRISSKGGDVFEGFAIANQVRAFPGKTIATVDGIAASMASVVMVAADKRRMAENGFVMIHEARGSMLGATADRMEQTATQIRNVNAQMHRSYVERTGMDASKVSEMMAAETWMGAETAHQLGFSHQTIAPVLDLAAHADMFSSENFNHTPDFAGMNKTRLSLLIGAALPEAADERQRILEKVADASAAKVSKLETVVAGSSLLRPTVEEIEAFALHLNLDGDELKAAASEVWQDVPSAGVTPPAPRSVGADEAELLRREGAAAEAKRVSDLKAMFQAHGQDELLAKCIDEQVQPGDASTLLLQALGANIKPATPRGYAVETYSRGDKFKEAALMSIQAATDFEYRQKNAAELARNEFAGYSLSELARASLDIAGVSTRGMDKMEIVGASFTTSDFPNILRDAANKMVMGGFEEQAETWRSIGRIGNLNDFKPNHRVTLSEYDDLLKITNGSEEYKRGEFSDLGEPIVLDTYGRLFKITRQAVINDDTGSFTEIPRRMGSAAGRLVGNLAWTMLWNGNPSHNEDSTATYHADHNNLVTAALDQAALDAGRTQMMRQPGPLAKKTGGRRGTANASGATHGLNIAPSILAVPVTLLGPAISMVQGEWMFAGGQALTGQPNIVRGIATPVADARMDNLSTTGWILSTNPNGHPTMEIGFLGGNAMPRMEQQNQFTTDGVDYKVSIDVGVQILDWRGLYKSTGA